MTSCRTARSSVARRDHILCVARAFNGPGEDQSAWAKGPIGSDQSADPSAKGHRVIAQLLRALGYRPLG